MASDENTEFVIEEGLDQELRNILNNIAPPYGETQYWNDRYRSQTGESFEWIQPWPAIYSRIEHRIAPQKPTGLVIGCGNSKMSFELLRIVGKVHSIDISSVVINEMKERYSGEPRLEWQRMDCTKMNFPNNSFDYVFDKGTIDTLVSYDDDETKRVEATVKEVARVLRPGGYFVVVSFGIPETRKRYFDKVHGFSLEDTIAIEKPESKGKHFVYISKLAD